MLLNESDEQVLTAALRGLAHICSPATAASGGGCGSLMSIERLRGLTDSAGIVTRCVDLLRATVYTLPAGNEDSTGTKQAASKGRSGAGPQLPSAQQQVTEGSLRVISLLCCANCCVSACADSQIQAVIDEGALPLLVIIGAAEAAGFSAAARATVCAMLSNILAGSRPQVCSLDLKEPISAPTIALLVSMTIADVWGVNVRRFCKSWTPTRPRAERQQGESCRCC